MNAHHLGITSPKWDMELVHFDGDIGPHLVFIDKVDGERFKLSFSRDEIRNLKGWCDAVLGREP